MSGEQHVEEHLDDHALWDVALGEPVDAADHAHVAACDVCRDELQERRDVASVVADPPPSDLSLRPPARVLDAVRAELSLAGTAPTVVGAPAADRTAPVGAVPVPRTPVPAARPTRRRRGALVLAAAAVVVGVGALGAGLGLGLAGAPDDGGTVVARADLGAVDGGQSVGTAVLHEDGGRRVLDVEMSEGDGAPAVPGGAYEEVWLLGPDAQPLVSLGVLGDGRGSFAVPAAAATGGPLVVDVSVEPLDGRAEHSGDSVARGEVAG